MNPEDADEEKGPICVDCGAKSPPTETNYTLISARHGWRLTPEVDDQGVRTMRWRCPTCWARYRKLPR